MKYYIGSTSVIDNLYFPNGNTINGVAGGAGIYALAGAKLWSDDVQLVCSVGNDYKELFSEWYKTNQINMDNLHLLDEKTPVTEVYYQEDGEREENSKFGLEHYHKFEFSIDDFLEMTQQECGVYVFRNVEDRFWQPYLKRNNKKAKVLWEIAADACIPECLFKVKEILPRVDVFSLNLTEARSLFQTDDLQGVISLLHELNVPLVFLRLGKKGQIFLKDGNEEFVPSLKNAKVVDATGGGNSSSGGVLVGFCENCSLTEIGDMANRSAVMCLSQYGIPLDIPAYKDKTFQLV